MKGVKAKEDADRIKKCEEKVTQIKADLTELQKKKRSSSAALTGEDGDKEKEIKAQLQEAEQALKKAEEAGLTQEVAAAFFKGSFGKLSVEAMFNEVDVDNNGNITKEEFVQFWGQVKQSGYSEEEIIEEIQSMTGSGEDGVAPTWVDWKDDRDVVKQPPPGAGGRKNSKS